MVQLKIAANHKWLSTINLPHVLLFWLLLSSQIGGHTYDLSDVITADTSDYQFTFNVFFPRKKKNERGREDI